MNTYVNIHTYIFFLIWSILQNFFSRKPIVELWKRSKTPLLRIHKYNTINNDFLFYNFVKREQERKSKKVKPAKDSILDFAFLLKTRRSIYYSALSPVGWLVGQSVRVCHIFLKGWKLHFPAPIGALVSIITCADLPHCRFIYELTSSCFYKYYIWICAYIAALMSIICNLLISTKVLYNDSVNQEGLW